MTNLIFLQSSMHGLLHLKARCGWLAAKAGGSARLAALLMTGFLLAIPLVSIAQAPKTVEPATLIESARKDMIDVRAALVDDANDASLLNARRLAMSVQTQAEAAAEGLSSELADVQARLAELGTPAAGVKEPADIALQRAQLVKTQSALDSQAKLARLLSVEAQQAASAVWSQRRSQFNAQLFERARATTSAAFWQELGNEWPADKRSLVILMAELRQRISEISSASWLTLAFVALTLVGAGWTVQRILLHVISTRAPTGRLRRSLYAALVILLWTLVPGVFAHALFLALTSSAGVSSGLRGLLAGIDGIVWFGGFSAGLGLALLMPGKPSWRLPPISDRTANRLRWFPPALAVGMVAGWIATRLSTTAEMSLALTVALKSLAALTLLLLMLAALAQIRRSRREQYVAELAVQAEKAEKAGKEDKTDKSDKNDKNGRAEQTSILAGVPLWLPTLISVTFWLLILTFVGLLACYVALGSFMVNQMVWALIVASAAYFLMGLVDDLFMALLAPTAPPLDDSDKPNAGLKAIPPPRTREQTAVLFSGLFRVILLVLAFLLLLAPFGEGPLELFRRAGRVNEGLTIGEIRLLPATLLQGVLVLVVGLLIVRTLKTWLGDRFMPTTRMDAGMRMSITTLFGYIGGITVVALSMSAVGVGLERVAWVASALSVGIGFGLQAVVQNFVSGLILLAERPVKVGDWVSLAGIEGDIRRINVRATEIQMGDRSTVIVPNSEFITKIVRNVTYTDPIGMVQIKLPMPLATDAAKAREVLLDAFLAHPGILEAPKPSVQLDGIDRLYLVFNATGFVSSPRAAYGVKSDLLFDIMKRLHDAGLALDLPPTLLMSPAAPGQRVQTGRSDDLTSTGPLPV